jgi:hypothetical protein
MIETNQNNKANVYLVSIKKASAVVLAKWISSSPFILVNSVESEFMLVWLFNQKFWPWNNGHKQGHSTLDSSRWQCYRGFAEELHSTGFLSAVIWRGRFGLWVSRNAIFPYTPIKNKVRRQIGDEKKNKSIWGWYLNE